MATRYRFSVEEFERVFAGVKNLELLEGEIYQMSPIGPKHMHTLNRLTGLFAVVFSKKAIVSVQNPIRVPPGSELEPDLVLLSSNTPQDRLPEPQEVLLVIEVSDTTLEYDRKEKLPVYAGAGIPEYWVVNLIDDVLEVYREPIGRLYRTCTLYKPGETVEFMGEKLEW
jgi:Uma2 family endonuclease